ncbi:Hexose-6-phosphate:phosphate antiporter [Corynebacterium pseudotuberculosis]|nr:Hexose-6-phosphate:phosphate antiporter [Corynebacterium pseudotuberculosis]
MTSFFDLKKIPNKGIFPLEQQRKGVAGAVSQGVLRRLLRVHVDVLHQEQLQSRSANAQGRVWPHHASAGLHRSSVLHYLWHR